jgi:AcrR family transcriptional regulator
MIAIGVDLLAEEGADALSLRKVARRAGVSHNAPYQHFADKEALLAAIAEEGFHILGEAINASQATAAEPKTALMVAGQAYVRFALDHPGHFQIMFSPLQHADYPDLARAARVTLNQLIAIVSAIGTNGDAVRNAQAVWAMLHGLSSLLLARKIPPDLLAGQAPEALVAQQIDILWHGLKDPA